MVITRTLSIAESVNKLERAANRLLTAAQDFDSLEGNETGLPELVKQLNMAVQQAGDARDDIEAAVDEYLNEGDDEYTDDEEDDGEGVGCSYCLRPLGEGHEDECPRAPWNDDDVNAAFDAPDYSAYDEDYDERDE